MESPPMVMMPMTEDRPLRILHLTSASHTGGVSRYLFDLCSAMHATGHQVAIAGEKSDWHDLFESAPFPWIEAPLNSGPISILRAPKIIRKYLDQHPVDLLHAHYRKATIVGRRLQRGLRGSQNLPLLYTLHGSHIVMRGHRRWFSDFGDYVHVTSSEGEAWFMQNAKIPADRIAYIPLGVDESKFPVPDAAQRRAAREQLGLSDQHKAALFVGRMENTKNEDWMLDLAAESRQVLPNLRVLMVGNGPYESHLKQRIDRENLSDRVKMLGWRDPISAYHAADALLLPSPKEGFSLVCMEAMCTSLPVLRTRTSGTAELIVENVTGKSVPIEREAFIRTAIEFMTDDASLPRMGRAAAQRIREKFTYSQQVLQTLALYRRLVRVRA
jgi:glycosyltransferase involved in cell wall biosynthesis